MHISLPTKCRSPGNSMPCSTPWQEGSCRVQRAGYIPPHTFYAVGGHKIFRDNIYAGMRFVFQADYRYYCEHGMFDFPQAEPEDAAFQCSPHPADKNPRFRKKVFADMKHHMIEPFGPVLEDA